ncbi:MAG TPA: DUF3800 domain-containing protein [Planctomycetota bacterium]|nr:DUF3800 domain-containing protein [Planctomycetota bacterium]
MADVYNVYCDESGHLEHDGQPVMVLGGLWCPLARTRDTARDIRAIKARHDLPLHFEVKWTKVSPARVDFYLDLVRYFFQQRDLLFRALVIPDKSKLRHEDFDQDHDTFYYKMYFEMLKAILKPDERYRIYLDIKDTRSAVKMANLRRVLSYSMRDFSQETVERIQTVRSDEVEQVQLVDLLIGAVGYANREFGTSPAKGELVQAIREHTGYVLTESTPLREDRFNVFIWRPRETDG